MTVNGSTPVLLNDDDPWFDAIFPEVTVDGGGDVHVFWHDWRGDAVCGAESFEYMVSSGDGGVTWGPNRRVSDERTFWTWASGFRAHSQISHPTTTSATVDPINNPLVDYRPNVPYAQQGGPSLLIGTVTRCFGSYHPGGCHFAMGDASVHFISENTDLWVLRQRAVRDDGLPLGEPLE